MTESPIVNNPPKALALAFGFEQNYILPSETSKRKHIEGNEEHCCKRCGIRQKSGFLDPAHSLIGANANDLYSFADKRSHFLCDYCIYNASYYAEKYQKSGVKKGIFDQVYGDMANIVLAEEGFRHFIAKANEENELYDILVEPPKEPFILLIKKVKGPTFETAFYNCEPTIDPSLMVVNYGREQHYVSPEMALACAREAVEVFSDKEMLKKLGVKKVSEDIFFNRSRSVSYNYWLTSTLRASPGFMKFYGEWMERYDHSTRLVAKMILQRMKKELKDG